MQRTNPIVKDERFYLSETDSDPIVVGTPAWYDWLEQQTAFTFVDHDWHLYGAQEHVAHRGFLLESVLQASR